MSQHIIIKLVISKDKEKIFKSTQREMIHYLEWKINSNDGRFFCLKPQRAGQSGTSFSSAERKELLTANSTSAETILQDEEK